MRTVMQFFQTRFSPLVIVLTISHLASMGLQVVIPQVIQKLRNPRFLMLVLVVGWGVGPALGHVITWILPLAQPFAAVMSITSVAPCAPFLPPVVGAARGDVDCAGALVPVGAVGRMVFVPLLAPLLVKGLTLSPMARAAPLVMTVLIPLLIGAVIRRYGARAATKLFRPVKGMAGVSTALTVLFCLLLYGQRMLDAAGSCALASMTLLMAAMGLVAYRFGCGLSQPERSVISLGMSTRNIAAVCIGVLAISNGDPRRVARVVMWTLWSFMLAQVVAPCSRQTGRQGRSSRCTRGGAGRGW